MTRDERIAELTRRGYTAAQIAGLVGVTPRSVTRARRRTGISRPVGRRATPGEKQRAADMLADGASYCEVARTLGRSLRVVTAWHPHASMWDHRMGGQLRAELRRAGLRLT